uniref:Uncharacterized protein n=1 Tax=Physcomitrium patens TaxID=3218 RepID=A0A2K1J6U9_PHYPA|nr:hypothetical protein PHYPA_020358 [Physcomitrium patens]
MGNIDIHILTTQSPLGKNPEAEEFLLSDSSKTPHTTQQLNYTNTGQLDKYRNGSSDYVPDKPDIVGLRQTISGSSNQLTIDIVAQFPASKPKL